MASTVVSGVRLAGVASCVPENQQTQEEIAARFGADEAEKIRQSTGVEKRRVVPESICSSDLCYSAAERLLAELGWERDSIGGLIFVSQSPDYFAPATACVLHDRLGLSAGCAAFDINLGCSGYVYGLAVASQFASGAQRDGQPRRVLLLVGDTITKMLAEGDRSTTPLFGDAGSATALESDADATPMTFCLGTDGSGKDRLIVHDGGFRNPIGSATADPSGGRHLFMDGAEVFRFALSSIPKLYRNLMAEAGWESDQVDGVVFHQSNQFMLEHLRKRLKIDPDRFVIGLRDYGNASCTSIPLAMTTAWGGQGASISKRLALVGFGVGWSWGGVSLECRDCVVPPVVVLTEEAAAEAARAA